MRRLRWLGTTFWCRWRAAARRVSVGTTGYVAALGVPGLLLIAWIVLQALGALSWIPAVWRLRGSDPERRPVWRQVR